jgi:hypothetical protein
MVDAANVRAGGWIVASYKSFAAYDVDDPVFDPYEVTILCGKAATLLSSIRSLGSVPGTRFEIFRKLAHLKPTEGLRLVERLEASGVVHVSWKTEGEHKAVGTIESLIFDKAGVMDAVGSLFDTLRPSERARAAILTLEATLTIPLPQSRLLSRLKQGKISDDAALGAINDMVAFGLLSRTRETESKEPLIYNPYVFGQNAADAYAALKSLPHNSQEDALRIIEHAQKSPGVPFPSKTDKSLVTLLAKVGLIDISGVRVHAGSTAREFPTAPHVWGALANPGGEPALSADLIDDSKLLLNSLRYGEIFSVSSRGRINSPAILVNALISRGQVGPATAIGQDYPLPLARGIVSIAESRIHPGRFFMELMKRDVAEAVRDILDQNVVLPVGDVESPEMLERTGQFTSPEVTRVKRQLPAELVEARDALAFELRTYRKGA